MTDETGRGHHGEHALFAHAPLPRRPALHWPGYARIACTITLHLECMDFDAAPDTACDPRWRERPQPDPRLFSWYEYGNRVAIFRILDGLDRLGLAVTVAANALAIERYPYLVEQILRRGHEIAGHGQAANRLVSSAMPVEVERAGITDALARIEAATGTRPAGWISQDFGESTRTPHLLHEAGLAYVADWPNDDAPVLMTGAGGLVSLPVAYEWDDMRLFIERRLQAWHYPVIIGDALARLHEEGATHPRCLPLSIHPWVFGAPHRFRYLDETLTAIAGRSGIWNATLGQVAASFLAQSATGQSAGQRSAQG